MSNIITTKENIKQFINLLDEYVTIVDKNLNIITANNNILSKLKYSHDEIEGQSISKFFKIFNQREIENLFESVWNNNKTYSHIPFITKNNELIPVETKFKFPDQENKDYILLFSKELSRLNLNSDIFSTIFKTNPSLMCIMSLKERTVVEVNDSFLSVLEFERKEVIGKKFNTLLLEFDNDEYKFLQKQIYKNASAQNLEVKVKTKSGITKYGNLSTSLIYIEQAPSVLMVLADITEFKNSQLKLKRSERKYRDLTEMLPEMIYEIDLDGKVIYANQFAINKFGYTPAEMKNGEFEFFTLFSNKDQTKATTFFFKAVVDGKQSSDEYMVVKNNNDEFPVIAYTNPIIENNIIKGIRVVMIDISERKEAEDQIKNNLKYQETLSQVSIKLNNVQNFNSKIGEAFEIISHNIPINRIYIYENDPEFGISNCIFQWSDKTIKNIPPIANEFNFAKVPTWEMNLKQKGIISTNNIHSYPTDIIEYLNNQNIATGIALPMKITHESEGFIVFDNFLQKFEWQSADIILLRVISRIISNEFEKNRTEYELITSEKENRAIIDSIPDIIFRFNRQGFMLSMKSAQQKTPFIFKNINPPDYLENIFEKDLATRMLVAINVCLVSGQFQLDFDYASETSIWNYEARFQKMSKNEVIAIVRDVTEIKDHEEELKLARQIAEDASKAKSEFLANVSHEIRTPMNAILGFSEILLEKIDHPQYTGYLETILSSGRTLLSLINDILDLSKIEAGKLEVNIEPVSFPRLIKEMTHVFQHKASQKNLEFDYQIDEMIPELIYTDEIRLHQIIFNLVGNAIKYTETGFVKVNCHTSPTNKTDEINLYIEVADSGIGIPKEQQEDIFHAFTQQSGQSNRKFEGTGLGLAIAQRLVSILNGKIHLESEAGQGSTFTVQLNNVKIPEINTSVIKPVKTDKDFDIIFEPAKIMIVDDIEYNIMIMKSMIDNESFDFIEAESGETAIKILKNAMPDIIFMDIKMHGLSGYTTTEILRKDKKYDHIPIVAFTASVMEDEIESIRSLFNDVLRKPASRKQILSVLKKFLKHKEKQQTKKEVKKIPSLDSFDEETKKKVGEMVKQLNDSYTKQWLEVKDDLIMFELENFANDLGAFIKPYPCNIIKQYHQELEQSIKSFNIEEIEKNITLFPATIEKIENLLAKQNR